jgi:transposase
MMQLACLGMLCLSSMAYSYRAVSEALGLSLGTVYRHMARIRQNHPPLYRDAMSERRRLRHAKHVAALERRRKRSLLWGRRRYAAKYRSLHGRWPWEAFG